MRLHGMSRDAFERYTAKVPSWYYEVVAPGFKYNLTDIAAAIGIQQLKMAPAFLLRREEIARAYDAALADLPLIRRRGRAGRHATPGTCTWCAWPTAPPRPRRAYRAPVRRRHRHQRALHPAAPPSLLARQLRAGRRSSSRTPAGLPAMLTLPLYTRMSDADVQRVIA